jgi:hypothetical protein
MANDNKKNSSDLDRLIKTANEDEETGGSGSLFDDETGTGGGTGGQTDAIEFRYHDILSTPSRDDTLPNNEIRRLAVVHRDLHKERVNKQKFLREQRAILKQSTPDGPRARSQAGFGFGGGGSSSRFKKHPISDKAQFSGVDKQVTGLPNQNEANTNSDLQDKLENRLQNQNRLQNVPKFNPRPRPAGL